MRSIRWIERASFAFGVAVCAAGCGSSSDGGGTNTSGSLGQPRAGAQSIANGQSGATGSIPGKNGTGGASASPFGASTGGNKAPAAIGGSPSPSTGGQGAAGIMVATTGGTGAAAAGTSAAGSSAAGSNGAAGATIMGKGMCCPDGNCLCHGDPPAQLTSGMGPFKTAMVQMQTGTGYYPMDAQPPFAGVAICPGFLNSGPEMTPWGPFYASWGIVTVVTNTNPSDIPDIRAQLLLGAIDELKKMNSSGSGPLAGKMSGRYGTSGYSMGGGGTTIAATGTPTLNSSIGLAAWGGDGTNDKVPELLFCGDADVVAPCDMSTPVYSAIPDSTPKMMIVVPGATHFNWFDPTDAGGGMSGKYGLAFQKVYLEGDTRWKSLLLTKPSAGGMQTTNIK